MQYISYEVESSSHIKLHIVYVRIHRIPISWHEYYILSLGRLQLERYVNKSRRKGHISLYRCRNVWSGSFKATSLSLLSQAKTKLWPQALAWWIWIYYITLFGKNLVAIPFRRDRGHTTNFGVESMMRYGSNTCTWLVEALVYANSALWQVCLMLFESI